MNTSLKIPNSINNLSVSRVYPVSVAPMMERIDRHYRYFMRQITRHTLLYPEMIATAAIIHDDRHKLLDFSAIEGIKEQLQTVVRR